MSDTNNILAFKFSAREFAERAQGIIPVHLEKLKEKSISQLKKIAEENKKGDWDDRPIQGVEDVCRKFWARRRETRTMAREFSRRELRILAWSLGFDLEGSGKIFETPEELRTALALLDIHWRDSYLRGLLDCFLSEWNSPKTLCKQILEKSIREKLTEYQGTRNQYLGMKSNLKFFELGRGAIDLGVTLAMKNIPAKEATGQLFLADTWISKPYFAEVIKAYHQKTRANLSDSIASITDALEAHSNQIKGTATNKEVLSSMIVYARDADEKLKDRLKNAAFRLIGDPAAKSIWMPPLGCSDITKENIQLAQKILNQWLTEQFINVFFEKCINDPRRKGFWLRYAKSISDFRVFGPVQLREKLYSDNRVADYLKLRFIAVKSKQDVAAIVFLAGRHIMIEFSEEGFAFYAYLQSNKNAPSLENKRVDSVRSFTDGNLPMLAYRSGFWTGDFSQEGRLSHRDGEQKWESVFAQWLSKIAGINA